MDMTVKYGKPRAPQPDTIKQRLTAEIGSPAQIDLKGKHFRNTILTGVTDTFLRAGSVFVPFHRASVITLGKADTAYGYERTIAHVKGIGTLVGTLIRSGIDFIELEIDETDRVLRKVIPLNRYVQMEMSSESFEAFSGEH